MDLTRNTAKLIKSLTSAQSTHLNVGAWTSTGIGPFRDTTGVTTLSGTSASFQTVHFPVPKDEKVAFLVNYVCTQEDSSGSPTLDVTAGGWRGDLGKYSLVMKGTSSGSTAGMYKQWILGPFESARFRSEATSTAGGCEVGEPSIRFHLSTAFTTAALTTEHRDKIGIAPLRLPDVSYDT